MIVSVMFMKFNGIHLQSINIHNCSIQRFLSDFVDANKIVVRIPGLKFFSSKLWNSWNIFQVDITFLQFDPQEDTMNFAPKVDLKHRMHLTWKIAKETAEYQSVCLLNFDL